MTGPDQQDLPRPLYRQVKDQIIERIRSGALAPGARVPSESRIVADFGVSRMTANRALKELSDDGIVNRLPGVGTFVAHAAPRASLIAIRNIAEEIAARGHHHSLQIIERETISAGATVASALEIDAGTPVYHLVVVHFENGRPVQLEDRHVNPAIAPGFLERNFNDRTPTAWLVATVPADELEHTVEAILPGPREQRYLKIGETSPCLSLTRRSWHRNEVVTRARLIYPADRYTLYSRHKPGPAPTTASTRT